LTVLCVGGIVDPDRPLWREVVTVKGITVALSVVSAALLLGAAPTTAIEPVELVTVPGGQHVEDGTVIHLEGVHPTTLIAHIPESAKSPPASARRNSTATSTKTDLANWRNSRSAARLAA
jgi:hypothetical protein